MPINAFGGGPGSGKTYGVVENVILPAVADGRFVLTNVEGLRISDIYDYVAQNFGSPEKIICIGHIRNCTRGAPDDEDFFPGQEALDKPSSVPAMDYPKVWPGDLVIIDEATRHWEQGGTRVKRTHSYFFREHRHFSNEMGHTCDLVVIDPDITLLSRQLKGKIEMTSITHKPKEVGLKNHYVVSLYIGARISKKPFSQRGPLSLRPEIYALYKSYSHEKAKELAVDSRQNVFAKNKFLFFRVGFLSVAVALGLYYAWRYFHPVSAEAVKPSGDGVASKSSASAPAASAAAPRVDSLPAPSAPSDFSDAWRIVGSVSNEHDSYVVLVDGAGRLRVESPSMFQGVGAAQIGTVDGRKVMRWTGVQRAQEVRK
ncbi:zonula occludens toxin [Chromobacterium sp. ATCC 53434]|uniref:zonular occludens toxin domain-containing protein n=1 Tax=Chromobacterium sp. (strain ATCC 53434 / SC 14030) TaxID=2059672 RepID=UPI000C795451|nr:zonular occludens toxin domain-containing protein [Chromobacterium sp. ATCC 53434]AUH51044.1 zonula occludens toxin [Chromobacterium sp. ATCC 53434]